MDFLSRWRVKERKRIDYLGLLAALQLLMLLLFVFCFLGFSFLAMQVKEGMKIHDLYRLPVMLLSFFSSPIYWQVEKKKKIDSFRLLVSPFLPMLHLLYSGFCSNRILPYFPMCVCVCVC